ncbi:MAG: hypothetical protein K2N05_09550 [Muribaculaceae bacterium]|nr:hypothetical protein [Muribaculaceae bacterium]
MKYKSISSILSLPALIFSIILFSSIYSCSRQSESPHWKIPDKEISDLQAAIKNVDKYGAKAEEKADSLKRGIYLPNISPAQKINALRKVSDYYRPRMADSALAYANKAYLLAKTTGEDKIIEEAALTYSDALSASGYFSAAITQFDSISLRSLDKKDRILYWSTGRQLYSNICNYIGQTGGLYDFYYEKEKIFIDSLLANLPEEDDFRVFLYGQVLINEGQDGIARKNLEKVLNRVEKGSQTYGMTAYQIAQSYMKTDQTKYAAYVALAAESDIIGGIRDGFALPSLSQWLYLQTHYKEAFNFINFAINDAYKGSARMRLVNISSMVPAIDEAYRKEISNSLSDFALYAVMVSVILIIVSIFLALLIREMRKRRHRHSQLASLSKMKDSYIRDFIGLCSAYSEKYDSLAKTVTRKITAGQAQDLLKLVKSGKASESENEEFYQTIDRVFLSLYPNFIARINDLLQPDQRYEEEENTGILNPELRIYGFVRLGVTESAKIAKILNYSPNTVYAYRNRMRNKAISRDTFDNDVTNLDNEEDESDWGL